ncbi:TIGR02253 family HAD-type hydrolase [Candidatus Micrarchaeota archaeon]|nr:TIGR02253 family HAD-type hydrolase [Candidatus Micrarchaeota archaeon]
MIKVVLFDIDNTLFPSNEFAELARRHAISLMIEAGLPVDADKAYEKLQLIIKKYGPNYPKHFNALLKEFGMKPNPKIVAAGIVAYHQAKTSIFPYPDVPQTLIHLREEGYKVCAASQGVAIKQWDKLIRLGLHNILHEVFVTPKKSKKFYRSILRKLKLTPQEVVMVGDNIETDTKPAGEAGITTILVSPKGRHKGEADYSVKSIGEIPKILEGLKRLRNTKRQAELLLKFCRRPSS